MGDEQVEKMALLSAQIEALRKKFDGQVHTTEEREAQISEMLRVQLDLEDQLKKAKANQAKADRGREKALKEAGRVGDSIAAWDGSDENFRSVPSDGEYSVRDDATYVHYTSNNTLFGTQFHHLPYSGGKPRVVDASSDICGVPIDISEHDLIYAGAQKNLGSSGVTLVILSPWALSRCHDGLPTMLDYRTHVSKGSMFNTPNTFGIFVLDRVFAWIERNGGLEGAIERNRAKAALLYLSLIHI